MTAKNTSKTVGKSPPYMLVLGIVRRHLDNSHGLGDATREEYAARVFEAEKEALLR